MSQTLPSSSEHEPRPAPAQSVPEQSESVQASQLEPLVDRLGRIHKSLRISVTDVCNIRCQYCMPEEGAEFQHPSNLLSFDQIEAFVRAVIPLGVTKFRLTGGEPLLRPKLYDLVERLSRIDGVEDLAMTTNAMLLADQLPPLVDAGLRRLNISLDTLSESTFQRISRRKGLGKTLEGIEAARAYDDLEVKLNALVLRDVNLDGVLELVRFAIERDLDLRFIEFMPLDAERAWSNDRMVSGEELRSLISAEFGELQAVTADDPARPARDYILPGTSQSRLGFIDSVSQPFCGSCDRLRLTADGKVRNCLFGQQEWDISPLLPSKKSDPAESSELHAALVEELRSCVAAKHPAHGIAASHFRPPARAMYQIGG